MVSHYHWLDDRRIVAYCRADRGDAYYVLDAETAAEIAKIFTEVIIAPGLEPAARDILAEKKNLRMLVTDGLPDPAAPGMLAKTIAGGLLLQSRDTGRIGRKDLKVVTKRAPSEQEMDDMLDQGLNFVESMGFILTDQDIHLMDQADLQKLWQSLPLNAGLSEEEPSPGAVQTKSSGTVAAEKPAASVTGRSSIAAKQQTVVETTTSSEADTKQSSDSAPGPETEPETAEANAITENVDDLLAVVEAMRAKSTSLRARMTVPSAEEMKLRKEQLRETVGRILATL